MASDHGGGGEGGHGGEADSDFTDALNISSRDIPLEVPVLPVRDIVVFNYMILPLFVGRDKSVEAVEAPSDRIAIF